MKLILFAVLIYAFYIYLTTQDIYLSALCILLAFLFCRLLQLFFSLLKRIWKIRRFKKQAVFAQIDQMSGSDFEAFIAMLYKTLGYEAYKTPDTSDYGADVIAQNNQQVLAIQCKRYQKVVGIKAVQEIIGALPIYHATQGIVITNSYFTHAAKNLAYANHIQLIDRSGLLKLIQKTNL